MRFLLCFFLACVGSLQAQCPTSDLVLSSQADIDNFSVNYPGCTMPPAGITIMESTPGDITNLNGLSQITHIGGFLFIRSNASLFNLSGLHNLVNIDGYLSISVNNQLASLNHLSNLISVGGHLFLSHNNQLTNFSGLENLTTINAYITIDNNDLLTSLDGLNGLTSVTNSLQITWNSSLSDLTALQNLTTISGSLIVRNNGILDNLNGLDNVSVVNGNLDIGFNTALSSISGIRNIDPMTMSFMFLQNNLSLGICSESSICDFLLDPTNGAVISNNDAGCNNRIEIETSCSALPISLVSFHGEALNNYNMLTWETAYEEDNSGFIIERSVNGQSWKEIGFTQGQNTTYKLTTYVFKDKHPLNSTSYYRLKILDLDGTITYSNIIAIQGSNDQEIVLFPNPTYDFIEIANIAPNQQLDLLDVNGKTILKGIHFTSRISLHDLPSGIYFLHLKSQFENIKKKIVKL